ncbi:ABC transporter ATP-binding protein [Cryptosporangium sp. NPDC048952]|uniref:ABC transporter ATP-binding protein n=1 Tax=Cryptosporangium sp. NPDC048952 TaxID=3363961 RepID=UPI003713E716
MTSSSALEETGAVADGTPVVEFSDVTVTYPGRNVTRPAVVGVDLVVPKGRFVCVVGPSGCGKSTLLHVCSGLIKVSGGQFNYLGKEWGKLHPGIGYVTQRETLLPWKTVLGNIALPLKIQGVGRAERRERAGAMAASVGLGDWLGRYPRELSGGMRQRVQLARTLVTDPTLLLMDEPFGALDAVLRVRMQEFLKSRIEGTDLTTIFVTHDLHEALTLGDQIVAMAGAPGRIDQIDHLEDLPRGLSALELRQSPAYASHEANLWKTIAGNLSDDGKALSSESASSEHSSSSADAVEQIRRNA